MICSQIYLENELVYIISLYIHPGISTRRDTALEKSVELKKKILQNNPSQKFMIMGDFNTDIRKNSDRFDKWQKGLIEKLKIGSSQIICHDDYSFKHKSGNRKTTNIDFIILFNCEGTLHHLHNCFNEISDHKPLLFSIKRSNKIYKEKPKIPSKFLPMKFRAFILEDKHFNIEKAAKVYEKNRKNAKHEPGKYSNENSTLEKGLKILIEENSLEKMVKFCLKEFTSIVEDFGTLRTKDSKKAFENLQRLTRLRHFVGKREGGLVTKIKENDKFYEGSEMMEIMKNSYQSDHKLPNRFKKPDIGSFPEGYYLTREEILEILKKMRKDKAFSFDGFANSTFRLENYKNPTENDEKILKFLQDTCLNADFFNSPKSNFLFRGRLVALNKVFPAIGNSRDIRPIMCLSALTQFLYGTLVKDLNYWQRHRMDKDLIGFVPTQETGVN